MFGKGRARSKVGCVAALTLLLGCSDTLGPAADLLLIVELLEQDETGTVQGDGSIFPEEFRLSVDELPGIDARGDVLFVQIKGVFFSACPGGEIQADLDAEIDRLRLTIRHASGPTCPDEPTPWAFRANVSDLPGGTYDVEVFYEDTALLFGEPFSDRVKAFEGEVTVIEPSL